MKESELILQFACHFGKACLANGGTLERANDKMTKICQSYGLEEISIFSLNSIIRISAIGTDGNIYSYQTNVKPCGIHVEKLNRYNALANRVCKEKLDPSTLEDLLVEAGNLEWDYPVWMSIAGFILALGCICMMFNGTYKDVICVAISTIVMFIVGMFLASPGLNQILRNVISMFIAGCLAKIYHTFGLCDNFYTILLTNAFMLIPGIQLVNSIRNILRGNEMNGIIEMLKVILETFAIVIGIVISVELLGGI